MPSLKVHAGPNQGQVFPLRGGETLGRDETNAIQIAAPEISRRHMSFAVERGEIVLADLDSANGTFVNGARVTKHRLADGDVIVVNTVELRYSRSDAPAPRGAAAANPKKGSARVWGAAVRMEPPTHRLPPGVSHEPVFHDDKSEGDYSLDASQTFIATDLRLAPKDLVPLLQKRLQLMFEVSQALAATRDRDELLSKIVDKLFEVFPQAARGFILVGTSLKALEVAAVRTRKQQAGRSVSVSRTIARKVYEEKKAILSHNAAQDDRFAGARSIVNLEISAFIVAPLLFREDCYGLIQLESDDLKSRFSPDDLNLLAGLAASAAVFLKNMKLIESIEKEIKERETIQSELRFAHRIQAGLLPKADPEIAGLEVSGRMKTAKEVGGDIYDYIVPPSSSGASELTVAIGDVSGKGAGAGLVMVMARSILHSLTKTSAMDPKAVAIETNRLLKPDLKPGMFLSLILARFDSKRGKVRLAGCGHERPLVFRARTGKVEKIDLGGLVLGVVADNSKNVAEAEISLDPGDQILFYTDGVPEALDASGKQYTLEHLEKVLAEKGRMPPASLIQAIEDDVARHAHGAEQHDDITIIAARRRLG
ncbi:SpoIIE family protein phosphatase [bacterium]|nr:SpoIIE family protein phosphatase [bacterium]